MREREHLDLLEVLVLLSVGEMLGMMFGVVACIIIIVASVMASVVRAIRRRGAEIPQQSVPHVIEQDVVRVQVAVRDATLMHVRRGARDPAQDAEALRGSQPRRRGREVVPRAALQGGRQAQRAVPSWNQLHDEPLRPRRVVVDPSQRVDQVRVRPGLDAGAHLVRWCAVAGYSSFEELYRDVLLLGLGLGLLDGDIPRPLRDHT